MTKKKGYEIGKDFGPEQQLKKVYYIYLVLILVIAFLPWYIPVLIFSPMMVSVLIGGVCLLIVLFVIYWIGRYYDSISYRLTDKEIIWRRGVWFRNTGIVPFDRITNVDISQGPISRRLGIGTLKVQTAGYSTQSSPEINIAGVKNFEELRDIIMKFVERKEITGVDRYESRGMEELILDEVIKIRKLLEERK